jgi:hypothetical protein
MRFPKHEQSANAYEHNDCLKKYLLTSGPFFISWPPELLLLRDCRNVAVRAMAHLLASILPERHTVPDEQRRCWPISDRRTQNAIRLTDDGRSSRLAAALGGSR